MCNVVPTGWSYHITYQEAEVYGVHVKFSISFYTEFEKHIRSVTLFKKSLLISERYLLDKFFNYRGSPYKI